MAAKSKTSKRNLPKKGGAKLTQRDLLLDGDLAGSLRLTPRRKREILGPVEREREEKISALVKEVVTEVEAGAELSPEDRDALLSTCFPELARAARQEYLDGQKAKRNPRTKPNVQLGTPELHRQILERFEKARRDGVPLPDLQDEFTDYQNTLARELTDSKSPSDMKARKQLLVSHLNALAQVAGAKFAVKKHFGYLTVTGPSGTFQLRSQEAGSGPPFGLGQALPRLRLVNRSGAALGLATALRRGAS